MAIDVAGAKAGVTGRRCGMRAGRLLRCDGAVRGWATPLIWSSRWPLVALSRPGGLRPRGQFLRKGAKERIAA